MADIVQYSTYARMFLMDNTGYTPTVTLSKAGGAFAAAAGTVTEIGSQWYKIVLTTVDTNTAGDLAFHITAGGAADVDFTDQVVSEAQASALTVGSTANFSPTRNGIIDAAYRKCRVLGLGETLSGAHLSEGITALNFLIRQMDEEGRQVVGWGSAPTNLALVNNQAYYDSTDGLPTNLVELRAVSFRDANGTDTPLTLITMEGYEAIADKYTTGDPSKVYLVRNRNPASHALYVWPLPQNVGTQSEVTGSDALNYVCIRTHTSDSTNQPITGANWRLFWEQSGSSGSAWATGTAYTAPKLLRLWYTRPLADFTAANDNPDLPLGQSRILMLRLAADLAVDTGKPVEFEQRLRREYQDSERRVFRRSNKEQTTDTKHFVRYF